jgi:prepilin peptidase CpaA
MTLAIWHNAVIAFAVAAAAGDVWSRKIPRWFTVAGFFAGLLFHWRYGGLVDSLEAAFLAFVIGIFFFSIGAIGGGDVKLITALGAMLGLHPWMMAMQVAVLAAAVMAVIQVVRRGAVRRTVHNMGSILHNVATRGFTAHPEVNVRNPMTIRSPFGVAAAIGVIAAVIKL